MIHPLPKSINKLTIALVWDEFVHRAAQLEGWRAECRASEEQHDLAASSIWRQPAKPQP